MCREVRFELTEAELGHTRGRSLDEESRGQDSGTRFRDKSIIGILGGVLKDLVG